MNPESTTNSQLNSLTIGQEYQGGVIFYIDETGKHGLIAAKQDLGPAPWGSFGATINGARSLDDGITNTKAILTNCNEPGIAARLCDEYVVRDNINKWKKYDDWFMPAFNQFTLIMQQLKESCNFCDKHYWVSTEASGNFQAVPINSANNTWRLSYSCSSQPGLFGLFFIPDSKTRALFVRPIRAF